MYDVCRWVGMYRYILVEAVRNFTFEITLSECSVVEQTRNVPANKRAGPVYLTK